MKSLKIVLLFILFLIEIVFISCVPSKPTEDIEVLPSERLINKLEANRRRIRNFEGVGVISIQSDFYNNNATFSVKMIKPDSLYFTVYGPFGIELAQAVVTNNSYLFYDVMENKAYKGTPNDDILTQIFKVNLSFNDLMDAFIGSVNLTSHLYKQPDRYDVDYDKYVLTYSDSAKNLEYIYKVDMRELSITDYIVKSLDGKKILEGNYSNFEILNNVSIPFKIRVHNIADNQLLGIDYENIQTNNSSLYIDFVLPDDALIVNW